jgi:hypothetical protein
MAKMADYGFPWGIETRAGKAAAPSEAVALASRGMASS